ncbi:MAG: hypothetical protein A2086_05435 [Spirochaetes bacterium GWD1_27_9]|nr:MAG: hypothetical protein A2Z98_15890 [Spirochaetes bacterium GWB1_27_13]OHD26136.1 MAG: hypothetical protein A2Y34_07180 [Spirochaetes bacterium GWC1_27_15]OHD31820.1 MAG: hypothetical protein A2086_05435 [Spirochaetes bacterium GWD1_27_9]
MTLQISCNDNDPNSFSWKTQLERVFSKLQITFSKSIFNDYLKISPDNFNRVFSTYKNLWQTIQNKMSNKNSDKLIDHHKIIASYIKSILINKPFDFDRKLFLTDYNNKKIKRYPPIIVMYPNIYFSWLLLLNVLSAWGRKLKDINYYFIIEPNNIYSYSNKKFTTYEEHFFKLLYQFIDEPKNISEFKLAHILFFIELSNDCVFFNLEDKYYDLTKSQERIELYKEKFKRF